MARRTYFLPYSKFRHLFKDPGLNDCLHISVVVVDVQVVVVTHEDRDGSEAIKEHE